MSWVNLILFHIDLPLSLCTNILRPHQGQKEQDLEWVQTISKKVCIITKYVSYDLHYIEIINHPRGMQEKSIRTSKDQLMTLIRKQPP